MNNITPAITTSLNHQAQPNSGLSGRANEKNEPVSLNFPLHTGSIIAWQNTKDWLGRDSIFVEKRVSGNPGFGTESTRLIFQKSMELGYGGRFHNDASWTSHFFHLYMGMIPVDRELSYTSFMFGSRSSALNKYENIMWYLEDNEKVPESLQNDLQSIKEILSVHKKLPAKEVSDPMVIDAREEIDVWKNKKCSYLKDDFIPSILEILEKNASKEKPDTNSLFAVKMVISDEGIARWKDDMDKKKPFASFKKLEHLRCFMNEEQIKRLDAVMLLREKIWAK